MIMSFVADAGNEGRKGDLVDQALFSRTSDEAVGVANVLERERREMLTPQIKGASGEVLCRDCGRGIPERRLEAKPYATRCATCQETLDRKGS